MACGATYASTRWFPDPRTLPTGDYLILSPTGDYFLLPPIQVSDPMPVQYP